MGKRYGSLISYFGGKTRLAPLYPRPQYPLIIEPFAGGASYSIWWRSKDRDVLLNELREEVVQAWRWLIETPTEESLRLLPETLKQGEDVRNRIPKGAHPGLAFIIRGMTQGRPGNKVTKWDARDWCLPRKIKKVQSFIRHWKVRHGSYEELDNVEATWFIDPPYSGEKWKDAYDKGQDINYTHLAEWCRSRKGQVIVCENEGADWLPFRPLKEQRAGHIRPHCRRSMEVIWTNEKQGLLY